MNGYYCDDPDHNRFYQGDVLSNYDIVILPDKIAQSSDPGTDKSDSGSSLIYIKKLRTNIIIISQTCDIENREFVAVCPVFPITRIKTTDKKESIRRNSVNYRFWLPAKTGFLNESYADFQIINTIKIDNIVIESRLVSLTERYRAHLTNGLSRYFCRPITIES